jgi:LmbE family N-acetylglucosaminyl deacetylase
MILFYIIIFSITIAFILWIIGFWFQNDFGVPTKETKKLKNVLLIFPHADDEVSSGGLLCKLAKQSANTTLVILTKGERGNQGAHLDTALKAIRVKEAEVVSKLFGIKELAQEDFGDGNLVNTKDALRRYLSLLLKEISPDLVVTYDLAGMYGHEDHIICSEIVTELVDKMAKTSLWYVSLPKRVLDLGSLPEHMAKDPAFKDKRAYPNLKIFIGLGIANKIRAVYSYKSQYLSFRNAVPFHIPLWFIYSMQTFEYFKKVK